MHPEIEAANASNLETGGAERSSGNVVRCFCEPSYRGAAVESDRRLIRQRVLTALLQRPQTILGVDYCRVIEVSSRIAGAF